MIDANLIMGFYIGFGAGIFVGMAVGLGIWALYRYLDQNWFDKPDRE
ncbi:MAG: hypothetical protein QXL01_07555 [Thermoplasmatales archaeon]